MTRYKLVLFDFDGTLADTFPWFVGILNDVAAELRFRRVEDADIAELRGLGPRQVMRRLEIPWWKVPLIARSMRRRMKRDVGLFRPFEGVPDMLARLSDEGLALAVVTSNTEETVRDVLGASAERIGHWQCGASMFGKAKRFRAVTRAAGLTSRDVLCVGDELRDAEAARAAGIDFAAVTWGFATPQALLSVNPALVFERVDDIAARLLGVPSARGR